jgi:CRP/FNR family transcriptional regulator, cyclic AMP receptor protein
MSTFSPSSLKELPLFSTLLDAEFGCVLPFVQLRKYTRGMLILGAGSPIEGLYIIVSGRVKVLLEDERGHQVIVAQLSEKDIFGELGVAGERQSREVVEALTTSEIIHVPRKAVLECLQRNATAAMFMLNVLTERLSDARRKIASLALQTASTRVVEVLLEHAHEEHGEWRVDVGAETIAAMVGASREMVSRIVRNLIQRGLVRRHKRKIIVTDRLRLAESVNRTVERLDTTSASSLAHSAFPSAVSQATA